VDIELVVFDAAGKSVEAVRREQADIGFFAIDPLRGEGIAFTAPYVLIEGSYLVSNSSALTSNDEVDQPGVRVAVGQGSAYDLFLSRELQHAEIVRAPTSPAVVEMFVAQQLDVAAWRQTAASSRPAALPRASPVARSVHGDPAGHGNAEVARN